MLASLLSSAQVQFPKSNAQLDAALPKLYKYLSTLTNSQDSGLQDIAVQEYSALLRTKKARELFWKQREETVNPLVDILRTAVGAVKDSDSTVNGGSVSIRSADGGISGGISLQLLYHVLLAIWQLSFEGSLVGKGLERYSLASTHVPANIADFHVTENKKSSLSTHNSSASPQKRKQPASCSPLF